MMQNSESNLKFNLKSSDFLVGDLISKTPFSDYFKAQYQNQPEFYLLKRLTISKNNDNLSDITKELSFYDSLSQSSLKLKSTPNYFGYFTTNMPNDIVYNVIFEYFPNSLSFFFEQKQKEPNKKFLSLATLQGILTSMLNVLAYLQANQMCCCGLNPMLLQLDESQNIKFIELGSFQEMKNLKSFYLKKLVKITNSDYMSPENHQFLTNLDSKTEIDPYKSEAFSLGLVILELATFKPLKFKNNLDILAPELKSHFFILSEIYSNSIHTDEEIQKFEHFYKILSKLLQIEAEVRWDFLEAFQNCIYRKEKILYHMFIEESTLGELQGIEWNNFRRIALKKVEEKEVKSIYQKDFEEYMEEIKICDVEAMKKFDYFLSEKGVQGVSFGNLHPEKVIFF